MTYNHKKVSSSTIKTYLSCPRKWYYDAFSGAESTSSSATRLGTEVHKILEKYLKGIPIDECIEGATPFACQLATRNIDHMWLPEPRTCQVEYKFEHESGVKGEIDCIVSPENRTEEDMARFGSPRIVPLVLDHKTSSSINSYALNESTLRSNMQAVIYSKVALDLYPKASHVDLVWNYMQTSGITQKQVLVRVSKEEIEKEFTNRILPFIHEMKEILELALPQEETFKRDTSYCSAYGGCSRMNVCNPPIETSDSMFEDIIFEPETITPAILVLKGKISDTTHIDQKDLEQLIRSKLKKPTEENVLAMLEIIKWQGVLKIDRRKKKSLYILPTVKRVADITIT